MTAQGIQQALIVGEPSGAASGPAGGDLTGTYPNPTIAANAVTNTKLADMAANTVKSNPTAAPADPADLAVGANTVLGRQAGNIVAAQVATGQVADDAVTNTKLANMPASTIKGNNTGGVADPLDLTAAQVRTLLNIADGATATRGALQYGADLKIGDAGQHFAVSGVATSAKVAALNEGSEAVCPFTGTINLLTWNSAAADATTKVRIMKNGVSAALVSLTGLSGTAVVSVAVVAGDKIALRFDSGTGPTSSTYYMRVSA